MVVNAKCNPCKEPTKYVVGFFDGPRGRHGCLFDCKNERCEVYQVKRFTESEAVKERIKIQNLNSQKGMYAGYIAALRKDAKITMMKMSQIAGCSPAEYSSYEHERKEFDPEIYRKCEKYLKENMDCQINMYQGDILGVELPNTVELKVVETEPGIKGDTTSGGSKPATLETGVIVNVPFFVNVDDVLRIDTRSGEYIERA